MKTRGLPSRQSFLRRGMINLANTASLLAILIVATSIACATFSSQGEPHGGAFDSVLSTSDVNDSIFLQPMEKRERPIRRDELVSFTIHNRTDSNIGFAADFGVQALYYDPIGKRWRSLPNTVEFPDVRVVLGGRNSNIPSVAVVDFSPAIDPPTGVDLIRILVEGELLDSDFRAVRKVAAYHDYRVSP
jgi:hypothetical protein